MRHAIALSVAFSLFGFVSMASAVDREECFEACDTKMEACLAKCPEGTTTHEDHSCRNACAENTFQPCLNACPNPRTGLSPAQKEKMKDLEEQRQEQ